MQHEEKKHSIVLVEKRDVWKTRYKEAFEKYRIQVTMKTIKRPIWGYVLNGTPKFREHLWYYLDFDGLHKQGMKFLSQKKKEVEHRDEMVEMISRVLNNIPPQALELLGLWDQMLVCMDANTCFNK